MSVLQQPVCRQPLAVSAGLGRLLCRFDFRQKVWGLVVVEFRRDFDSLFPDDSAALVIAISRKFFEFSRPSPEVAQPATGTISGVASGLSFHPSTDNFVAQKGREAMNHPQHQTFKPKGDGARVAELLRRPCRKTSRQF